jgi:hypothetical protein
MELISTISEIEFLKKKNKDLKKRLDIQIQKNKKEKEKNSNKEYTNIPERNKFIKNLHNNYLEIEENNEDDTIHKFPQNIYKNGEVVENDIYGDVTSPPYIICQIKDCIKLYLLSNSLNYNLIIKSKNNNILKKICCRKLLFSRKSCNLKVKFCFENINISEISIHSNRYYSRYLLENIIRFKRPNKTKKSTLIAPRYESLTKDITNNSSCISEQRKVRFNRKVIYL